MESDFLFRAFCYNYGARMYDHPKQDRLSKDRMHSGKVDRLRTFICRLPGAGEAFYPGKYSTIEQRRNTDAGDDFD